MNRSVRKTYNEILKYRLPVDIVYTNETGEFCFALSVRSNIEKYGFFWMGTRQTLRGAQKLAERLRLPVLGVFYPYGEPRGEKG